MSQITGPIATLLVGLVGALVLLHVHRLNAYRAASTKFRAAVLRLLAGIYPTPTNWPQNIDAFLRSVFPELQSAVSEFRAHVSFYKLGAFDRAWFHYRCATGRPIDLQCYHHYMGFSGDPDPKDTLRKNVDALLSFARQP